MRQQNPANGAMQAASRMDGTAENRASTFMLGAHGFGLEIDHFAQVNIDLAPRPIRARKSPSRLPRLTIRSSEANLAPHIADVIAVGVVPVDLD
jgi:hypothetical protein